MIFDDNYHPANRVFNPIPPIHCYNGTVQEPSDFPIPLKIRRNARAKSMVLRLSPCGQEARLTIPKRLSEKRALAFAQSQRLWLEQQLTKQSPTIPFVDGSTLPLFGVDCQLTHLPALKGCKLSAEGQHTQLLVGGDATTFAARVERWIKNQAKLRFGEIAHDLSHMLDTTPAAVTVRDTSSRWGSCSHARRISLNWRLAFAPESVYHYVIAHEVAHLVHFDHSPAFWQVVTELHPDYADAKNWLRRHGRTLHRYGK